LVRSQTLLIPQAPNAPEAAVLALVKASAVIQDSAFDYDQKTRNYAYYTLLRLSKETQSIGVKSLPSTVIAQSPQTKFEKKGWQPGDLVSNQSSGMFVLDTAGGVSKLVVDQQGSSRIEKLFQLEPSYSGLALTASAESVFVVSDSQLGCTIHKYSLTTKAVSRRLVAPHERCAGITTDGNTLYVTMPDRNEIRYWVSWEAPAAQRWSLAGISSPGYLIFDAQGHRLIVTEGSGRAYAISIPDGKNQLLASNLGFINSIATSQFHILVASGDKVLFLARSDNRGENPPSGLQSLTGGRIVGVVIDATDKVWLADYDKKIVQGPFPLS
jgi:hypothetical protein